MMSDEFGEKMISDECKDVFLFIIQHSAFIIL